MEQNKALDILKSGRNVFLTGSAGTGKTHVLNEYIKHCKKHKVKVAVTASTGIAATHMRGTTIHSWSGIGVKTKMTPKEIHDLTGKKYLQDNIENAKVLIIDEISMLHKDQIELLNVVLQEFKGSIFPFGGMQVVLCGDFFQLPPIGEREERSADKFAFMSLAWLDADLKVCYLDKQYRQNDDDLTRILNEIRSAKISQLSLDQLNGARNTEIKGLQPTKLYSHNIDVDRVNEEFLERCEGKKRFFKATSSGKDALVDTLKSTVIVKERMYLKIGAKVMFVKNNPELGYINGTLGEITGYSKLGIPLVKTSERKEIAASPEKWSIDDDEGKSLASFTQIPLRLAWAITVHKCQGMTLDSVEMDLSKVFERGQGYVALSRVRSLDKLTLKGFNAIALQVDPLAFKADLRFQELSNEVDVNLVSEALEKDAKAFIKSAGGSMSSEKEELTKKLRNKTFARKKKRN